MFTATNKGQIRIFDVSLSNNKLQIKGSLKLDLKVKNLSIFHNNERLLIVNGIKKGKNLIFILNVQGQKIMNVVG